MKKVEATRDANIGLEPRRMSAEEKDALLKAYHPDYREEGFDTLQRGPQHRATRCPRNCAPCWRPTAASAGLKLDLEHSPITTWTC